MAQNNLKVTNTSELILVDEKDYSRISQFKWYNTTRRINRTEWVDNKTINISIANEVMNTRKILYDHINGDYLDNRKINLRVCTITQNNINRAKPIGCRVEYKGVDRKFGNSTYRARIRLNNKRVHLGYFNTAKEAALAYNNAAVVMHGEFAILNDIE